MKKRNRKTNSRLRNKTEVKLKDTAVENEALRSLQVLTRSYTEGKYPVPQEDFELKIGQMLTIMGRRNESTIRPPALCHLNKLVALGTPKMGMPECHTGRLKSPEETARQFNQSLYCVYSAMSKLGGSLTVPKKMSAHNIYLTSWVDMKELTETAMSWYYGALNTHPGDEAILAVHENIQVILPYLINYVIIFDVDIVFELYKALYVVHCVVCRNQFLICEECDNIIKTTAKIIEKNRHTDRNLTYRSAPVEIHVRKETKREKLTKVITDKNKELLEIQQRIKSLEQ